MASCQPAWKWQVIKTKEAIRIYLSSFSSPSDLDYGVTVFDGHSHTQKSRWEPQASVFFPLIWEYIAFREWIRILSEW